MSTHTRVAQPRRLAFLDTLRALAVLAVMLAHMLSEVSPSFGQFRFSIFDSGSFGVTVFFMCSGFIIQPSIEHAPSLRSFWRRRIYRLYPLYWCSVLATAAVIALGLTRPNPQIAAAAPLIVLANLTMLQNMLGAPHLQIIYWSLSFELIFYLIVTFSVFAKINRYSITITAGMIGATLIVEVVAPLLGGPKVPLALCGFLVIMFSGVLFHRAAEGQISTGAALSLAALGLAVNIAAALVDSLMRYSGWWDNLFLISAWSASYVVFIGAYALRDSPLLALPPLQLIGRISYSIYLLHLPITLMIPPIGGPIISVAIWSATTLGVATITFRAIEQPMIRRARAYDRGAGR
ncbi:acyltransferase [Oscillochloris sp. ZM17-4]|uniref:acyltransferase family protein n=1 Tax=Oscillochloris sp. ZM17-4 TaxID=2866714 RepID=UPI001C72D53C|nr:acyltransferase [Oscillochloris sp. ZM17-4]MBX0330148.1 acyltransferase [Oscillochloris sp. ZM17-4]